MLAYNLANGLSAQSKLNTAEYTDWFLQTADIRRRERILYQLAGLDRSVPGNMRAQAFTNLGNALLRTHRFVEAYDSYSRALQFDSSNGIALTGVVRLLRRFSRMATDNPQRVLALAGMYLKQAKANPDRIRELAGEQGYRELLPLLETDLPEIELPDFSKVTKYQQFVIRHRLSLVPSIEGLDPTLSLWDSLRIPSVTEKIELGSGVPPLFGMFNVLKADFLAVRYIAYMALSEGIPESGKYSDTLDYARYGVKYSLLTLAQRSCMDLLDKVAIAASEYLSLPGDPKKIYFSTRWFEPRKPDLPLSWQPEIKAAISKGNKALFAISEVSEDLGASGFLHPKKSIRNSSTHRFTILHDLGVTPSRPSQYIEHESDTNFIEQLIETLQLTRSVLIYFVDMVAFNEHLFHKDGAKIGHLFVPDHDWILGEEEE
jgi:tetratricopeptide (TPR) repeat protein